MVTEAKYYSLLKEMDLKLGLGLMNQFQKVMILVASAKKIMVSFVLVIFFLFPQNSLFIYLNEECWARFCGIIIFLCS